ncbi:membrane protein insertion efficiency factor YidD [Methanospirillum sp. J.3.6.1-F.2.7.3]|uniref:Membrane protein insertion efficiency factor YidD n=1 Tax=Methanospirillum purgamenti TaxID=2834276 RepID=A0A8E7B3Z4_9EURY|nr:membrane protein insertion efficiency factor YidD [Methanospirillum sp. J.3.6.1-F.2.7.3]
MINNPLVLLSIIGIRIIWHGKIGRTYNRKKRIICRFHPSCSNYAIMALKKHGFFRGWAMAIGRIKRCNPKNLESCIDYP